MSWAKLYGSYESHPKFELTSLVAAAAVALHAKAIAHSAQHLTDGEVRNSWVDRQLALLRPKQRREVIDHAIGARLFDRIDGGYLVHDYLEHNRSREQVEQDRLGAAKRQADRRDRQRQEHLPWEGAA
jgi:hypothetical protein